MKARAEWHDRVEFAEAAEALGVDSDQVMAMLPDEIALFTTEPYEEGTDPMIFAAKLGRDADGILVAAPPREVCRTSVFHEQMDDAIRKAAGIEVTRKAPCGADWFGRRPGDPDCGCGWGDLCEGRDDA